MKIKRSWLLAATAGLGIFMILYTLVRQFTGFSLGDRFEKNFFDFLFIAAIGLFMLNRKLAADEAKEAAAAKAATAAEAVELKEETAAATAEGTGEGSSEEE